MLRRRVPIVLQTEQRVRHYRHWWPRRSQTTAIRPDMRDDRIQCRLWIDDDPARLTTRLPRVVEEARRPPSEFGQPIRHLLTIGQHGRKQEEIRLRCTLGAMQQAKHRVNTARSATDAAENMALVEYNQTYLGNIRVREAQQRQQTLGRHHLNLAKLRTAGQDSQVSIGRYRDAAQIGRKASREVVPELVDKGESLAPERWLFDPRPK